MPEWSGPYSHGGLGGSPGEVAEWSKANDSKSFEGKPSVGSNPTLSVSELKTGIPKGSRDVPLTPETRCPAVGFLLFGRPMAFIHHVCLGDKRHGRPSARAAGSAALAAGFLIVSWVSARPLFPCAGCPERMLEPLPWAWDPERNRYELLGLDAQLPERA